MNIKSILRSIRFLALLIGNMMMAGCSNSDKPAYLEPHLITTEATHITRTEATLNGAATIEGETEMPKFLPQQAAFSLPADARRSKPLRFRLPTLTTRVRTACC